MRSTDPAQVDPMRILSSTHFTRSPWRWVLAPLAVVSLVGIGCSDDTKKDVEKAAEGVREDAEDATGAAAARTVAESFLASLKTNDIAENDGLRSIKALNDVADDLPAEPDISGIEDADGDGFDDDGKVGLKVEDKSACVVIPESGGDSEVTDEAC